MKKLAFLSLAAIVALGACSDNPTALTTLTAPDSPLFDNLQVTSDLFVSDKTAIITAGGAVVVNYNLQETAAGGMPGCDVDTTNPADVTINVPAGVTADPSAFSISACGSDHPVTFSSSTPSPGYAITADISGGKPNAVLNPNPANFTLVVEAAAPTCTAASVTSHPDHETITYGQNATFTAAGSGDPIPTVQWQVSTDHGTTWADVPGETNASLTVTKPTVSQSGSQYRAVFTNECGGTQSATSNAATLTVDQKELTVSGVTAADKVWDGTQDATLDFSDASLQGIENGDDVELDTSNAVGQFDDANVGANKTVTITGLGLSGDDSDNYTLASPIATSASILAWYLTGFYQPVGTANSVVVSAPGALPSASEETVWNRVRSGATVPLRFNVYTAIGDGEITTVPAAFNASPFTLTPVICPSGGELEAEVDFTTAGTTSLRYDDLEGQFIQNWATPRNRAGSCFRVAVTTKDGSHIVAFFQLR